MMIKLVLQDNGVPIYIAPEHVVAFHKANPSGTLLYLSRSAVMVKQSPDQVRKLLTTGGD